VRYNQSSIALSLDENEMIRTNLTRCVVLDHDYAGTLLRDYTPKISLNFGRVFELEIEIKQKIGAAFYSKMKEIKDQVKLKN
jgi:hypothetical protein